MTRDYFRMVACFFLSSVIVVKKPEFDENANAWYLDTGAGFGKFLTGAKVAENGEILEMVSLKILENDISN